MQQFNRSNIQSTRTRTNLVTAVAGVTSQMLVETLSDVISDTIIFPLVEKALGRELPTRVEICQRQALERQIPQQVGSSKDAVVDAPPQAIVEASASPVNPVEDAVRAIEDSVPLQAFTEEPLKTHSPSPLTKRKISN